MARVLIGSIAGAIVMFVVGFLFFATPLMKLSTSNIGNAEAAALQQSLATNLPSTGTYFVPDASTTAEQSVMYGQGPIATIHYTTGGYSASDMGVIIGGLILDFATALLMGAALLTIGARVPDFPSRARVVVLFSLAAAAYMHLGEPIWYHHDVANFVYLFIGDAAAMIAGGLVIARWFLPRMAVPVA
jgi:hypothetical protein